MDSLNTQYKGDFLYVCPNCVFGMLPAVFGSGFTLIYFSLLSHYYMI